ncbi:MAG: hypothetical protein BWY59_01254 [Verrucomicrobia bacterium ADurb.Bin345]|nr:MAG: hypothetical protein BWY59_01254 [Verrucomicrobia bacterium ADurb.Bin345]
MGLVITGGVVLVLAVVLGVMLFRFQSSYQQVRTDLKSTVARLDALYGRDPYPSEENVELVQSNLFVLSNYHQELVSVLKLGQVDPASMEPADFPQLLDRTIRRLYDRAREQGVKFPARFAFGFERYALGALPNHEDVSRLVMQVRTIEKLCEVLFKSKVSEMENVQRTVFERGVIEQGGTRDARRRMQEAAEGTPEPVSEEWIDPSGQFARESYTLTFRAMDGAVWAVLNELAKMGLFTVVARVELSNNTPLPKPSQAPRAVFESSAAGATPPLPAAANMMDMFSAAPQAAPVEAAKTGPKPHEERVVAGREMVRAIVEVHVYRFLQREGEGNQP